ncbi:putative methionine--tRNA ligase, cytoplasmic [Nosema granulosis]|uniref:methionine--tRNA ligase n=1 Tax=Nosema granulosis TaxID=83296 RepID=A0A9P6KYF3_9MICR|nr:putative methionine--tRNA ligase, cytoplasmic [Nosema granulosis]
MSKKIITSALPYVNNQPHLGNIIGCVLSADVYSRYCKKNNEEAVFLCGTDEYGTAIEIEALKKNKKPIEICNENRIVHKKIYDWFEIKFDFFGQTTAAAHTRKVQEMFFKIYENGYFEEKTVEQYFCTKCETFLADRYVEGTCKYCGYVAARGDQCDGCGHTYKSTDLVDPQCTICRSIPVIKETTHLFFDFGVFKEQLEDLFKKNSKYWTDNGKAITRSWLDQELLSRCMTRDLKNKWGVPVPLKGYENKVFYVWFDAVIGYYTFLEQLVGEDIEDWMKEGRLVQFMGKDNVFFHTIVFPSMIFATHQKLPLIERLSVTEFLLFQNEKFSKSRGHGIFGMDLVDNSCGPSDIWRYYLLKIRPERVDSNFQIKHFSQTITADLNNNIGNFCNRVLKYINNKCQRTILVEEETERDIDFVRHVDKLYGQHLDLLSEIKIKDALEKILEISKAGNEYVQKIIDEKMDRKHGFSVVYSVVVLIGQVLEPFIPSASERLLQMCNVQSQKYEKNFVLIKNNTISENISPLFSKLDDRTLENLSAFNKF